MSVMFVSAAVCAEASAPSLPEIPEWALNLKEMHRRPERGRIHYQKLCQCALVRVQQLLLRGLSSVFTGMEGCPCLRAPVRAGVDEYAVSWQNLGVAGVASELLCLPGM
eukprot:1143287-Pelagomonas_calceolata.AAC.2